MDDSVVASSGRFAKYLSDAQTICATAPPTSAPADFEASSFIEFTSWGWVACSRRIPPGVFWRVRRRSLLRRVTHETADLTKSALPFVDDVADAKRLIADRAFLAARISGEELAVGHQRTCGTCLPLSSSSGSPYGMSSPNARRAIRLCMRQHMQSVAQAAMPRRALSYRITRDSRS